MLPRLALFCFCFTAINTKPADENLIEDIEHTKTIRRLEVLNKILIKVVQHSTAIQQQAAARSVEAHQSLLLPSKCSVDGTREIEIGRKDLLIKYYKCSIFQILEDIASLDLDFAKYLFSTFKASSVIVTDVLACTSAGFNPFTFIFCIYKAVKVIPEEVKDIISLTEDFENSLDTLLPSIYHGIKSCFNSTSKSYEQFLDDVFEKVKVCDDSRNM